MLAVTTSNKRKRFNTNKCKYISHLDYQSFFVSAVTFIRLFIHVQLQSLQEAAHSVSSSPSVLCFLTKSDPQQYKKGLLHVTPHWAGEKNAEQTQHCCSFMAQLPLLSFLLIILILNDVCPAVLSQFLVRLQFHSFYSTSDVHIHKTDIYC